MDARLDFYRTELPNSVDCGLLNLKQVNELLHVGRGSLGSQMLSASWVARPCATFKHFPTLASCLCLFSLKLSVVGVSTSLSEVNIPKGF